MLPRLLLLASLCSAVTFGQLETNTVTVSAVRTLTLQPDQVIFGLSVTAPLSASLSDVLAALQPVGVTAAGFSGVSSQYNGVVPGSTQMPQIQWSFTLQAAFASMKATVSALTSLQQTITQNNSGLTLAFVVAGSQVSQQLQQMQVCPLSELLSDAQLQAQKLANVAGASLGAVLAIAGATPNSGGVSTGYYPIGAFVSSFQTYAPPPVCSMTVKFSLLH